MISAKERSGRAWFYLWRISAKNGFKLKILFIITLFVISIFRVELEKVVGKEMVETCLLLSDLDNKDCWRCCITFRKFMIMVVIIFMQKMHQPFKRQSQSSANCRQTIDRQIADKLSVFDHFVKLTLKGLKCKTCTLVMRIMHYCNRGSNI